MGWGGKAKGGEGRGEAPGPRHDISVTLLTPCYPVLSDIAMYCTPLPAAIYIPLPFPPTITATLTHHQVLSEIATYRAPSMAAAGCYTLKREAWREFDPHFLHYGKRTLSRAWERALQVR